MIKKILLFIVEGASDKDALEPILSELFDTTRIHFEVLRCDITTKNSRLNIKERISEVIKGFLNRNHGIKKEHIEKIILLSDSDGCYIRDQCIYFSQNDIRFRYEDNGIYTDRPDEAIERNKKKSTNLNIIHATSTVLKIPIETYYFSCNLDHVLHNKRNLEQHLKEDYAFDFADQFEDKEIEFIDYINQPLLFLDSNYAKSWMIIKVDKNSLLRYTNLNVFFFNNKDYLNTKAKMRVILYQEPLLVAL